MDQVHSLCKSCKVFGNLLAYKFSVKNFVPEIPTPALTNIILQFTIRELTH